MAPTDKPNATLRGADLTFIQRSSGYRFSMDPVLLAGQVRLKAGGRLADLGSGEGIILLLLARRMADCSCVGFERQPTLVDISRENLRANQLQARVEIRQADIRKPESLDAPQSYDVVVTNPPYRIVGSGRVAPDGERAAARHELAGGLEDFLKAAAWLLKNGGQFHIIHLPERLAELLAMMRSVRIEPKRLRCIHSRSGEPARLVLVEGRRAARAGGLQIETPLYLYEGEKYSSEVLELYGELDGVS
jgi:tRNA1Val (adenine37-N6)-methyltransferase